MSVWVAAGAALLAFGLHLARRRQGYGEAVPWLGWRTGAAARWLRALVPPLSQVELGEGFSAFATLLGLTALALLPALPTTAIDLPIGSTPGRDLLSAVAALAFAAFIALRVRGEFAGERG